MAQDGLAICKQEVDRIIRHFRAWGPAHVVAVFVTPQGVQWTSIDSRYAYQRLVGKHAQYEIGHYNCRIDRNELLADVLAAAREIGVL